jgi:hypothetical protein
MVAALLRKRLIEHAETPRLRLRLFPQALTLREAML